MRFKFGRLLRFKTETIISSLSLAVAALSLIFAVYSVLIASRAQTFTENLENLRRSIVLVGDTADQQDSLKVKPLQPSMQFLSGYAYFPNEIIEGAVPIDSHGEVRWMGSIIGGIENHVSDSIPALEGHVSFSEGGIPVVVYSYYAFEGQVYEDWSLYSATFLAQVGSEENGGTKAQLTGLIYGHRMNSMSEDEAKNTPSKLWSSMKDQNFGLPKMSQ